MSRARPPQPLTRRRFVQGLAGAAAGGWLSPLSSAQAGNEFHLTVAETPVNFTGAARTATVINGSLPAPLLRFRQGETVTVDVTNTLHATTSLHWHGLIVPADMDGVPGVSFPGIAPRSTFRYRFKVNQSGTYWYHSHSRFQEQVGLYGPLIIEPRDGERHRADREHVVLLSDWSDIDPERLYAILKRDSDYFNYGKRTLPDLMRDIRRDGWDATLADRRVWSTMRMNATDLADVGGAAYTYLMNGATPAANWTGEFRPGERVRLRFINGSSMSFFDVRIPGLKLTVVAADGQDVEPVSVDEFRIGTAETLDVIVEPRDGAYTIFAQAMDRSGYARGTLTPRPGLVAEVPPLEPRALLTMADMGHGAMAGGVAHGAAGHDHSAMTGDSPSPQHPSTERGRAVDMVAGQVSSRLDDPGPGLRDNGRRVLTYADLHTLGGPIDRRAPSRDIELHLTGHMERFLWSFDGRRFSEAEPLRFAHGERLRITLVNDSMMTHPIHLHGMWSEIEAEDGTFQVRKHTVTVHPAQRIRYQVTADALGRWAYHCHLLYHMEAGMFREVVVAHEGHSHGAHP